MSDDIEDLLRSGLAARADAAPSFDDPGLADAAIAGAGRVRRRRRVAAAASGAGLLVLGAAAFVYQPWFSTDDHGGDGTTAADTSTTEAQNELGMEFVVQEGDSVDVINAAGDRIPLGDQTPNRVYGLADGYMAESADAVWTVSLDGAEGVYYDKPSPNDTYTKVNRAGEEFAIVTPDADYTVEGYTLVTLSGEDPATGATPEPATFETNFEITLDDWNDTTAVFTADLYSTATGNPKEYYFNNEYGWGLESVSAAGFESAVLVDATDPNFVCVSDLDPETALASEGEQCGFADDAVLQEELVTASGDTDANLAQVSENFVDSMEVEQSFFFEGTDLGEFQGRFDQADAIWTDPQNRWQLAGSPGASIWLLLDNSGEKPELSELAPPSGALMAVESYS